MGIKLKSKLSLIIGCFSFSWLLSHFWYNHGQPSFNLYKIPIRIHSAWYSNSDFCMQIISSELGIKWLLWGIRRNSRFSVKQCEHVWKLKLHAWFNLFIKSQNRRNFMRIKLKSNRLIDFLSRVPNAHSNKLIMHRFDKKIAIIKSPETN